MVTRKKVGQVTPEERNEIQTPWVILPQNIRIGGIVWLRNINGRVQKMENGRLILRPVRYS